MGWFNTLLQVAEVGLELGQLSQMKGLNEKQKAMLMNQMGESARQALLQAARDELFEVKQAAERAVELAEERPHVAVAMLAFQRLHLQRINLSPELFSDLGDKEYCVRTIRFITDNEQRLSSRLTPAERQESQELAQMALRVPDYQEYIELYPGVQKLHLAEQRLAEAGPRRMGGLNARLRHSALGRLTVISMLLFIVLLSLLLASESFLATMLGLGAAGAVGYLYFRQGNQYRNYQQASSEVETLRSQVNLERFTQLEMELGPDYNAVTARLKTMETRLERFFESAPEPEAILAPPVADTVPQRQCPNCQAYVPETAGFCHKCGTRLDVQKEVEV